MPWQAKTCYYPLTKDVGLPTLLIQRIGKEQRKTQGVAENSRSKTQGVEEVRSNKKKETIGRIIAFCQEPHTLQEIAEELGFSDRYWMKKHYIDPLLNNTLQMTSGESKNAPTQKYIVIRNDS